MNKKTLARYGLKWDPFSQEVPVEGLFAPAALESFRVRIEDLAREGGFALITGDPGTGKSAALRILVEHLSRRRDLRVGVLTRPQAGMPDFYREMGELFGVELSPSNRWAGTKVLRERWRSHVETVLYRPVLVIDEAQEMLSPVLNELRLLLSVDLDSRLLLTVVLAGDSRLTTRLRVDDLLPLASRIRVRLTLVPATAEALVQTLQHALEAAGNARLMTDELIHTLADHAAGNHRALMTMAADLLALGAQRELARLDEKLYFEVFAAPVEREAAADSRRRKAR